MSLKLILKTESLSDDFIVFAMPKNQGLRARLRKYIQDATGAVICDFSKIRDKRSTGYKSQNHHLNGHIMQIMRELGMTGKHEYDQVKTEIKRIAHVAFGYPAVDKKGHFFKSEADCNSEECAWLIEASHLLAADLGIVLVESEE